MGLLIKKAHFIERTRLFCIILYNAPQTNEVE